MKDASDDAEASLRAVAPRPLSFLPVHWQFEEGWSSAFRSARDRDDVPWEVHAGRVAQTLDKALALV